MLSKIIFIIFITTINGDSDSNSNKFIEYKSAFDEELYQNVLDEAKCEQQLNYINNINNSLVGMQFRDASGKIPSGLLTGNLADLGNYYQCLSIRHVDMDIEIEGKYCLAIIPLMQFIDASYPNISTTLNWHEFRSLVNKSNDMKFIGKWQRRAYLISGAAGSMVSRVMPATFVSALNFSLGTCIPKACTLKQAKDLLLQNTVPVDNLVIDAYFYRLPNDKPLSNADYVAMVIFSLIAFITVISTSYDLYQTFLLQKDNTQTHPLYRCFSIYTNTYRFLKFNTSSDALECMDGIRAISMLWVIFGHAYSSTMFNYVYNLDAVQIWMTSFKSTWINSAPITVDTFFLLSGILCVYTVIGKMSRRRFIYSIHLFYLYRLLRILPLLATVILLQASFFHQMSDGPMWINIGHATAMCRERWWSALLHVQNYVRPFGMCLDHTWYLSVDIQLYIAGPVVLVWLFGTEKIAWCALTLAIVTSITLSSTYSFLYNYSAALANLSQADGYGNYFIDYYMNTLTRASPFFIGMMYGYLLHKFRGKEIILKKVVVTIIWIIAFLLMSFCIFSIYPVMQKEHDTQWFDNFLNAYMRGIWAIAVGWMIFACVHGYGGPINWFLSLPMWKLPARLSYGMYLVHYPILMIANGSAMSSHYFSDGDTLYRAMGALVFSSLAAFILSITIDAPFSTIQKLLLGRGGNKKTLKPRPSVNREETIVFTVERDEGVCKHDWCKAFKTSAFKGFKTYGLCSDPDAFICNQGRFVLVGIKDYKQLVLDEYSFIYRDQVGIVVYITVGFGWIVTFNVIQNSILKL